MDPDANLREQREIAKRIVALAETGEDDQQLGEEGIRLAELVLALDEWLTNGGFLPTDWAAMR